MVDFGNSYINNRERARLFAQEYPCPWCGERAGFSLGAFSASQRIGASARYMGSLIGTPWSMITKGIIGLSTLNNPALHIFFHCENCKELIEICGYCYHPNRASGARVGPCRNCGEEYWP